MSCLLTILFVGVGVDCDEAVGILRFQVDSHCTVDDSAAPRQSWSACSRDNYTL